jgi:hypothetical protein
MGIVSKFITGKLFATQLGRTLLREQYEFGLYFIELPGKTNTQFIFE